MLLLPVKPRMGPLVARTAFHDSHSFSGNAMGLMTALRQMLSASDTVSHSCTTRHQILRTRLTAVSETCRTARVGCRVGRKVPFWLKIGRFGRVRNVPVRHGVAVSCNYAVSLVGGN